MDSSDFDLEPLASICVVVSQILTDLLGSIDDSGVVAKLQRADDGGAQREQQVAGDLLLLQGERVERTRGRKGNRTMSVRK